MERDQSLGEGVGAASAGRWVGKGTDVACVGSTGVRGSVGGVGAVKVSTVGAIDVEGAVDAGGSAVTSARAVDLSAVPIATADTCTCV